jgi:hypothetical protein
MPVPGRAAAATSAGACDRRPPPAAHDPREAAARPHATTAELPDLLGLPLQRRVTRGEAGRSGR